MLEDYQWSVPLQAGGLHGVLSWPPRSLSTIKLYIVIYELGLFNPIEHIIHTDDALLTASYLFTNVKLRRPRVLVSREQLATINLGQYMLYETPHWHALLLSRTSWEKSLDSGGTQRRTWKSWCSALFESTITNDPLSRLRAKRKKSLEMVITACCVTASATRRLKRKFNTTLGMPLLIFYRINIIYQDRMWSDKGPFASPMSRSAIIGPAPRSSSWYPILPTTTAKANLSRNR